ncbi:hypothetical protein [Streptomyces sp. NPDC093568]|uniref:hypothetical protein n=1 Tax=Streptomyces sp. NPDC093568 TaxID=3366041 RepID=UPI0037F4DC2C
MIEWVCLGRESRPVPTPVPTPLVWAGAFGGALVLVALVNTLVGTGRPAPALAVLSVLAAVLGLCARFSAAPGIAVVCWLFLNGFAIPPAGTLTWAHTRDTFWLACLLTAALVGTVLARVLHARAAYRRIGKGVAVETPDPVDGVRDI